MIDTHYFARRAEQELRMAAASKTQVAARIHYILAGYYLDLCHAPSSDDDGQQLKIEALWNHVNMTVAAQDGGSVTQRY